MISKLSEGGNLLSNKIKQAVEDLKTRYNTNNPFEICEQMDINVNQIKTNPTFKAFFAYASGDYPFITINCNYMEKSKQILCAHELGHIVLGHKGVNNFEADDLDAEREANLFALYMLFDESEFDIKFENMSNYLIKYTLDKNIILASK